MSVLKSASARIVTIFVASILLMAVFSTSSVGQSVGDRVVVTANFDTKIYNKVVGKVYEGSIHTVEQINGDWCKLDRTDGWLKMQYVMSLDMGMRHFGKRVKTNPNDFIAYAHRGMIYHELEMYNEAFTDLDKALQVNRKDPMSWMKRGIVLKAQGKLLLATKDLNEAISLNPKLPTPHFNMGLVLYAMENYKEAVRAFDKAIELYKGEDPFWFMSRGSAKLGLDDIEGAVADYRKALELSPTFADAHVGLSNIALVKADLEEAFEEADKAVELQPKNAMALNARGWVLYKLGKVDEAIYDLNRAIRYAPRLSIAHGNRGVCYVSKNDFDRAIADHSKHLSLAPNNPYALSNRGLAWFGKGDYAKAKADFEAAQKLGPELDESLSSYAWFLATCPDETYRNGKLAVEKASKACELSKNKDWYHLNSLASAYAETGDFDNAVKYAKIALDVAPENKQDACKQQLKRFQDKKPARSAVGKNAEEVMRGK